MKTKSKHSFRRAAGDVESSGRWRGREGEEEDSVGAGQVRKDGCVTEKQLCKLLNVHDCFYSYLFTDVYLPKQLKR